MQHNFKNFPFYWVDKKDYKKIKINNNHAYIVEGMCWNVPSPCIRNVSNLVIEEKNNYIFYKIKK